MEKILISACLVGDKTRYDGRGNYCPAIEQLLERYELVPFCPEVEGGLKTPRNPSERNKDNRVVMKNGRDVTRNFELGAELALNICQYLGIRYAILKDHSPSCGSSKIHDGTFSGRLVDGMGVTAELLRKKGITVLNENEIDTLLSK